MHPPECIGATLYRKGIPVNILVIDNSNSVTGAFKCAHQSAVLMADTHRFVFLIPSQSTNDKLLLQDQIKVYKLPMLEISKSLWRLLQYPFRLLYNLWRVRTLVKRERIDCVIVNDFYNLLGAGLVALGSNVKLITYVRFLPTAVPKPLRNWWINMAQRYSETIVAVSDAVKNQLPPHPKVIKLYDVFNVGEQLPYPYPSPPKRVLLYLANYTRGKGQELALAAFEQIHSLFPEVQLKFVGGDLGLEKNRAFRSEMEAISRRKQLDVVVHFCDFTDSIEALIKESYAMLNFSASESFSMTCLEASYFGTPVIATRCGGPEEIIVDDETGLLVPVGDIPAMVSAMQKLLSDEGYRNRLSANARTYVREKFSQQQYKENYSKLLTATR